MRACNAEQLLPASLPSRPYSSELLSVCVGLPELPAASKQTSVPQQQDRPESSSAKLSGDPFDTLAQALHCMPLAAQASQFLRAL